MRTLIALFALAVISFSTISAQAMPFKDALKTADSEKKYLFYLHGDIMETEGKNAASKRYGLYMYDRIISHYEDRGLTVIEEVRGKVDSAKYADKIVAQVRELIRAGVPASNITVSGFAKGGFITLLVCSSLNNPDVKFIVMAGCGKGSNAQPFERFLKHKRGSRLTGHLFSIYVGSDLEAGSCRPAYEQHNGVRFTFKETRIKNGKGHGMFYQPRPAWIEPTAIFARGGR